MPESVSSAMVAKRSRETGQKLDIHEKSEDYLIKCRTAAAYTAEKCGWRVVKCANEGDTTPYSREDIAKMVQASISDLI
jgi:dTMP kinase